MVYKWAAEYGKALRKVQQRAQGLAVEIHAPSEPPESLRAPRMSSLIQPGRQRTTSSSYGMSLNCGSITRPPETMGKVALAIGRFEAMSGDPSLGTITRTNGIEYRKRLLDSGMSPHAANTQMTWVQVLLNFEMEKHQRIPANPWKNLQITVEAEAFREEWRDVQAVRLFGLPLFQAYKMPRSKNAGLDAAYWVPTIGAFTGRRSAGAGSRAPGCRIRGTRRNRL